MPSTRFFLGKTQNRLRVYVDRYQAGKALRLSMADFRRQDWMTNLPLYALSQIDRIWTER